ncbi:PAS domain S-box-containing protein [Quadrisphaera granulorum]|uniref:PAS domain S-box-containing protein n=1 Tax=Quadrisphaera granulorum TaxID=317664 RepID=A0A316A6U6_9ACTN|nr:SpoIIE family protein phosphatase [Quadrisphaera granulorum]PWJ52700.1 PAS domain S-box-containing protein [Quadrisphaera granulorum]SZE97522.1 PAS domain S-box-containing protein [Quadrisphaera granulorum]
MEGTADEGVAGGETGLDRLAKLTARLVGAPWAQVSLAQGDVHRVVATGGAPEGRASRRLDRAAETLCEITLTEGRPVVVEDTTTDPRTAQRPAVTSGLVGSYLGVPLVQDGRTTGVLCAYGPTPRPWDKHDVEVLEHLAASAVAELDMERIVADVTRSRLRVELAVDAAGVGSFVWDLASGELEWDDRLLEIFGIERADFGGTITAFNASLHPDDLERVTAALERSIATCGEFRAEYRVQRPGGGVRWVQARGRTLCDPTGRATRVVGAAYDTTEVHEGEARVARVLESMSAAFYSLDRDFRFTYVNAEAERLLGRPRSELLGGVLWDLFPATLSSAFESGYRSAMDSGQPATFEAHYPPPLDGWYEVRVWPVPDGLSVYFLEITERRRAQERADAAVARLALIARTTEQLTEVLDGRTAVARLASLVVPQLADWSLVSLVDDGGPLRDVGWAHVDPACTALVEQYATQRSRGLHPTAPLLRALATGEPQGIPSEAAATLRDVLGDDDARRLLTQLAPQACWVFPLSSHGRTFGALSLFWGAQRPAPGPDDLALAREVAARAGTALENARLYERQRDLAEELQRSLLTAPPRPDHLEVAVRYLPAGFAAQVGGDWYDAFVQADGGTVVVIGDVVGHDTAAAAAMGQLRGLLRGIAYTTGAGPADVLQRLDAAIPGLLISTTATAAVVRLEQTASDRARGITALRWSSAGHPPPFVLHPNGSVVALEVDDPDLLLGIDPASTRQERVEEVGRGTTVVLYSDGLVERRGQSLDVGLARLRAVLAELGHLPLQKLCDALLSRLVSERPEDDVALVAVRLLP